MVATVADARRRLVADRAKQELLVSRKVEVEEAAKNAKARAADATEARALIQTVARQTQQTLEFHVSSLVSSALEAVFPSPYEFAARFVERRNKTECDLFLTRGGKDYDPMTATGGGVVDVASFGLRAAFWALTKRRPVLILDEPFKFVSEGLHGACSEMLKALSEQLGIQIIMISHLPGIIAAADRVIKINQGRVEA